MTSAEDQEIMARIGQLAGQINRKKNEQAGFVPAPSHYHPYRRMSAAPSNEGRDSGVDNFGTKDSNRYRGGYAPRGRPPTHRHRTLILNGASPQIPSDDSGSVPGAVNNSWVTRTDRHLQLINTSVYEKETQARTRAIEQTRRQKQTARDERERSKLLNHLNHVMDNARGNGTTNTGKHELDIQGIRFLVVNNGGKLVKLPGSSQSPSSTLRSNGAHPSAGDSNSPKATPKMAIVGGVRFYRSKNGNLYRHGIVKAQRYVSRRYGVQPLTPRLQTIGRRQETQPALQDLLHDRYSPFPHELETTSTRLGFSRYVPH